ncbi:MAG TPA: hypothetical protein VGD36_09470 [Xanthobacteraceae bacterium]|jgi:hypothetical protein
MSTMSTLGNDSGRKPSPAPTVCDHCGAPMRRGEVTPYPERDGELHLYECTACKLPTVHFVPRGPPPRR